MDCSSRVVMMVCLKLDELRKLVHCAVRVAVHVWIVAVVGHTVVGHMPTKRRVAVPKARWRVSVIRVSRVESRMVKRRVVHTTGIIVR